MAAEIGASELTLVLILLCVVVVPIATIAFARAGKGLENLGKGPWSIDREEPRAPGEAPEAIDPAEREEEVRQLVEAADFRRRGRGEPELDVEAETNRLLGIGSDDEPGVGGTADGPRAGGTPGEPGAGSPPVTAETSGSEPGADRPAGGDPAAGETVGEVDDSGPAGIRDEIRQLVIANNERRERRGEPPLDVESEVERRLRDWA